MATVYKILSPDLTECYVGSTTHGVGERWRRHKEGDENKTMSRILFERYGRENCKFMVMEICSLEERFIKEQWWLEHSVGAVNAKMAFLSEQVRCEEKLAYNKAYCEENREKLLAQKKEYYQENRDTVLARVKAHCEANREDKLAYNKAYYEATRDAILAQKRVYYQAKKAKTPAEPSAAQ